MMGVYQEHILPHLVNLAMRTRQLAPYRERTIRLAGGRVLEIGVGSGLNLPLYTDCATEIVGLDPHPRLLAMASEKAARRFVGSDAPLRKDYVQAGRAEPS